MSEWTNEIILSDKERLNVTIDEGNPVTKDIWKALKGWYKR